METLKKTLMVLGVLPILLVIVIGLLLIDVGMVKSRKHASIERAIAAWNAETGIVEMRYRWSQK